MRLKLIIYSILSLLLLTNCQKEEIPVEPVAHKRTVLAYMVASNLDKFLRPNISQMMTVASDEELNGGNLVVYYSENKSKSYLFQIRENESGVIITDTVRRYENLSGVAPSTMRQVMQDVTTLFPADSYGLILSSHGTSWLPTNYSSLRAFGEENKARLEITEMNEALNGFYFDFILFDACYMSGVECAYELRDKTAYYISSPTEILAQGFPYADFLPGLFQEEPDVAKVVESYYNYYNNNGEYSYGTVSLIQTSELEALATIIREILSDKTEQDLYALPLSEMQVLEYLTNRAPHMLYDLDSFIRPLATDEQYTRFTAAMEKAVISKYATPFSYYSYGGAKPINQFSGLSVFVPQPSLNKLLDWYKQLAWYSAVY